MSENSTEKSPEEAESIQESEGPEEDTSNVNPTEEDEDTEEDPLEKTREAARKLDYNDPFQRLRRFPPYTYRVREDYGSLASPSVMDQAEFGQRFERQDEDIDGSEYKKQRQQARKIELEAEGYTAEEVELKLNEEQPRQPSNGASQNGSENKNGSENSRQNGSQ